MNIWEELECISKQEIYENITTFDEPKCKDIMQLNEMANIRGKDVMIDDIDFSFYISRRNDIPHAIRLKVYWDRNKTNTDPDGYMEMHGDYKYFHSSNPKHKAKNWEINGLRYFCKKYKVLFAALWESKLEEPDVSDFFRGRLTLKELLATFDNISEIDYYHINHCKSLRELEKCVRDYKIFNMND